ncbi:TPA: hypothetical protein HA251_03940 [Candidatus Woesearchaeota archaeon]|nr:hypothetical protein [Candidatus Woesearchaeota archaeon]
MVLFPSVFGPSGVLSAFFLKPENVLVALALIVPIVLLYLIKPKPVNVAVPSLMFILNDMGKSTIHRLFRTIFRDILFLLQVLIVMLLGLAIAKPFIEVGQESMVHQSILVVDVSASTRTHDDGNFESIIDAATESLASENVIVLARDKPVVLDVSGDPSLSAGRAKSLLNDLHPLEMNGNLPGALDLAAQHVGPQTKVTIISDFILSPLESQELIEAKIKVLRSKGAIIDIKNPARTGRNVGIIDATMASQNATITIRVQNFNSEPEEFGIEYNGEKVSIPANILAPAGQPGSLLSVSVPVAHGKSELVLTPKDDFMVDNHYYISVPDRDAINVLLISNDADAQRSKLIPAITSAGDQFTRVNLAYAAPPKIPDLNHQVYIIKDINTDFILPGVVRGLREQVEEGAVLVVFGQPDIFSLDLQGLMPVEWKSAPTLGGRQEILVNGSLGLLHGLTDIGQVDGSQLQRVALLNGSTMHAYVQTNDGLEPVIAHKRIGKGAVIYYGIKDQRAVDIDTNAYVVVWGRIVDYSLPDVRQLNTGTGMVVSANAKTITTPMGKLQPPVLGTHAGFYYSGALPIAANLYPLRIGSQSAETKDARASIRYESTIADPADITTGDGVLSAVGEEEAKVPMELSTIAIIIAASIMLFELLYVKLRGDL